MLGSFVFLISSVLLIVVFLFLKKTSNKLNIIKWIFISIVLLFCFNSFVVYILSYIKIPSNLFVISLIYILISSFIYLKFLRKEKQKYYFKLKDLWYLLFILLLITVISFIRFGFPFSITYTTLDPSIHFQSSYSFYQESFLLNFVKDKTILNFETWRFGSYVNLGIIFKSLSPFISENNFYNLYILFDIFTLFMTAVLFYYLINNDKHNFIKLIGTIFFVLGYPLNNLLIGFFYVGHASCIIIVIMMLIKELNNEKINFYLLSLLNIGLTFTYYLFIPFVFLTEFIYFIKNKRIILKYSFMFGLPIILGFAYFIFPTFHNTNMNLINQTQIDGYFYNDVIGNSLLFLPIISYYCYKKFKEKNMDFEIIMTIGLLLFILILNILTVCKVILPYYISKYYYILWIMCFTILFRCYDNYYESEKIHFNNYLVFMIGTIILSITNIENLIINLNEGDWNKTKPTSLFNVYRYNLDSIMEPIVIFTADEIEDIKKIRLNSNEKFITNGEPEQILWLIDFIQNDVVNCPVNNTYDCIRGLYQTDVQKFLNDKNNFYENKVYIYLSRDMYTSYNNINEQIILNTNNLKDNNIEKSKFGFVLRG